MLNRWCEKGLKVVSCIYLIIFWVWNLVLTNFFPPKKLSGSQKVGQGPQEVQFTSISVFLFILSDLRIISLSFFKILNNTCKCITSSGVGFTSSIYNKGALERKLERSHWNE